jgi:putative sugar O-methyltransferase
LSTGLDLTNELTDAHHAITDPRDRKRLISQYESLCALTGREFVAQYAEAEIGLPLHHPYNGLKLNPTDLRLSHAASRVGNLFADMASKPRVVAEIGGGYGGLACKMKQMFPDALVCMFDLPEVCPTQIYYLSRRYPDARIFDHVTFKREGIDALLTGDWDFAVLPGWVIEALPEDSLDLAANTRSMMEMNRDVVTFYMEQLNRTVRPGGIFYCVNRYEKAKTDLPIRIKEYDFDAHWYLAISEPVWDQGSAMHEIAAVRTALPNVHPPAQALCFLPPFKVCDVLIHLAAAMALAGKYMQREAVLLKGRAYISIYVSLNHAFKRRFPMLSGKLKGLFVR